MAWIWFLFWLVTISRTSIRSDQTRKEVLFANQTSSVTSLRSSLYSSVLGVNRQNCVWFSALVSTYNLYFAFPMSLMAWAVHMRRHVWASYAVSITGHIMNHHYTLIISTIRIKITFHKSSIPVGDWLVPVCLELSNLPEGIESPWKPYLLF